MIEAKDITVAFGDRTIFENLSFKALKGEKIAVTGKSGSGKSTLLKTLLGVVPNKKGTILIAEKELNPENAIEIRKKLCYIPQNVIISNEITVEDYIKMPFTFRANREIEFIRDEMLSLFSTFSLEKELLTHDFSSLSGGEKQRVSLVRGFLMKREIFLFDEVTSALDETNTVKIMDYIFNRDDITMLSVSHTSIWIERCSKKIDLEPFRNNGGK